MRKCCLCKEIKPLEAFYSSKSPDGKQHRCKDCDRNKARVWKAKNRERARQANRDWRARNPEHIKWKKIERSYGLTKEGFEALLAAQGDACAICQKPFIGNGHVDHCHITKKVRGLLCVPCNLGIGHLQEDRAVMERAIAYLYP